MDQGPAARKAARLGRLLRVVLPGVRQVHAQVAVYAKAWDEASSAAIAAAGAGAGELWAVLGDSTAQGIGAPSFDQGYVGQLGAVLNERWRRPWRIVNLSKSGARASDVLATQLPRLESLHEPPRLVTCAIGANDLLRTPGPRLVEELRRVISRLPEGAVIATLPQGLRPARAAAVNDIIRVEAPRAGLLVADVWAHTGGSWRGKLAADGFHPGFAGYTEWADAFAEVLPASVIGSELDDRLEGHPGAEPGG